MGARTRAQRATPAARAAALTTYFQGATMASTTNDSTLFNPAPLARRLDAATIEKVPLGDCEVAPNYRKRIDPDGIAHLAELMMRNGQIQPTTGWRDPATGKVIIYSGQRRYLAAHKSAELTGTDGYEDLAAITHLRVSLFTGKRAPSKQEIQRLQVMENIREAVDQADLQDMFLDCWRERAGLPDEDRIAAVCQDMGITPKQAHNLRKQITLPDEIRHRVAAKRRSGSDLSISLANRLAEIHETSPDLAKAVAERVTSDELHDAAVRDIGAFVHRTTIESDGVYSVRLNQGQLLNAADELGKARQFITGEHIARAADEVLKCKPDKLANELDALASRVKASALLIAVDEPLLDRITAGNFGWRHGRGERFADSIWLTDPVFMVDVVLEAANAKEDAAPAQESSYFAGAGNSDKEAEEAAEAVRKDREAQRERQQTGAQRNLSMGQDIAATLTDPSAEQLDALRGLICHLLIDRYPDAIAYGAGWTNPQRMQPVGDTSRYEPKAPQSILEAELQQAMAMRDPLAGIARLAASFGAAFMLDLDGVPRTKSLGTDRMTRRLRDALPGGDHPARDALWAFMRPMLSPALVQMHHDEFVPTETGGSTVDLDAHRAASSLDDIDLGSDDLADAA